MFEFGDILTPAGLSILAQVVLIDLTMAGDNIIVIGALAAGLTAVDRRRVVAVGIAIAVIFLIGFALIATQLLKVTGLLFSGGLLLLWVAFNMLRQLRSSPSESRLVDRVGLGSKPAGTSVLRAAIGITVADLSMSIDNVLAVAAAARSHPSVLMFGLVLSVIIMGIAANYIARVIQRLPILAWAGLFLVLYTALRMIWEGSNDLWPLVNWVRP